LRARFFYILSLSILNGWAIQKPIFAQNQPPQITSSAQQEIQKLNQEAKAAIERTDGWLVGFNLLARALRLAQENGDLVGEAQTLRLLAHLEANTGQRKEEALDYFMAELKLREQLGNLAEVANTYMNLGIFFQDKLHDSEEALGYFQQVLAVRKKNRQSLPEINEALLAIAQAYSAIDDYKAAIQYYKRALNNLKTLNQAQKAAELCLEIAQMYARAHNYNQAMHYAQQAQAHNLTLQNSTIEHEIALYMVSLQNLQVTARMEREQKDYWQWLLAGLGCLLAIGMGIYLMKQKR
jgi:tetratricopeptide (TPR) repeat protein